MAKFNYRELYRAVAASDIGAKRVNTVMRRKFEENKIVLLEEFDRHDVTQEIKAGTGAPNTSKTLNGEGDLFSFIGFDEGTDPIAPLRESLQNETQLISSSRAIADGDKVSYKFSLRIPTDSIKERSPLPWETGQSWAEGIEKGISGFGNYLRGRFRSPEPSRSGGGKQVDEQVRATPFKRRPYLSEIFRNFVARFK